MGKPKLNKIDVSDETILRKAHADHEYAYEFLAAQLEDRHEIAQEMRRLRARVESLEADKARLVAAEREACARFVEQQVEVRAPHDRAINSDRAFLGDAIRQGKHADE